MGFYRAKVSKMVIPPTGPNSNRIVRTAYANGKLYYLSAGHQQRAVLMSTDVTLQVKCADVMPLMGPLMKAWSVDASAQGAGSSDSSNTRTVDVDLQEGTAEATFPWEFNAYKKVVQIGSSVVSKELVCSKPKQPNTRPTTESCCVEKRLEKETSQGEAAALNNGCSDTDIIKVV